jgi:hypothetical protein
MLHQQAKYMALSCFGGWYSYLFGSDVPIILGLNTIMKALFNEWKT